MLTLDKLRGSFSKFFDEAAPSDTDALRKTCVSAAQRQNLLAVLADWRELEAKCRDYTRPSKRLEVLLWSRGVKSCDELPHAEAVAIEKAAVQGDAYEILHQDAILREKAGPIIQRARAAIIDLHATILPHLRSEKDKLHAILSPLCEKYRCDTCEIDDFGPVRKLNRSIADSESVAAGNLLFDGGHIEGEFATWL